jgi:hypothetical protein
VGKIAALMAVVVLAASAQCIADCGIVPCNEQATRPATPDCHHQSSSNKTAPDPAPPTDHNHSSTCGHQQFISESGPQAAAFHHDLGLVTLIAINLDKTLPETPILLDPTSDHSPPLRSASALRTILRV